MQYSNECFFWQEWCLTLNSSHSKNIYYISLFQMNLFQSSNQKDKKVFVKFLKRNFSRNITYFKIFLRIVIMRRHIHICLATNFNNIKCHHDRHYIRIRGVNRNSSTLKCFWHTRFPKKDAILLKLAFFTCSPILLSSLNRSGILFNVHFFGKPCRWI